MKTIQNYFPLLTSKQINQFDALLELYTEWNEKISAPIKKGDTLGYVNVFSGDEQLGRIPITAKNDVKEMTFWISLRRIVNGLFKL